MSLLGFVKQLIKKKLEHGISISIDLPSGYTVPSKRGRNENKRRSD